MGRSCPDLDCEAIFEPSEWKAVWMAVNRTPPPEKPPRLAEMVHLVAVWAAMSSGRKSEPGTQTLWIGLQRMYDLAWAWDTFGPGPIRGQPNLWVTTRALPWAELFRPPRGKIQNRATSKLAFRACRTRNHDLISVRRSASLGHDLIETVAKALNDWLKSGHGCGRGGDLLTHAGHCEVEQFLAAVTRVTNVDEITFGQREQTASPGRRTALIRVHRIGNRQLREHWTADRGMDPITRLLEPETVQGPAGEGGLQSWRDQVCDGRGKVAKADRFGDVPSGSAPGGQDEEERHVKRTGTLHLSHREARPPNVRRSSARQDARPIAKINHASA